MYFKIIRLDIPPWYLYPLVGLLVPYSRNLNHRGHREHREKILSLFSLCSLWWDNLSFGLWAEPTLDIPPWYL